MHFENKATVGAPRDTVWAFLMDVPRSAACVPGAEQVQQLQDADHYSGVLKVRVGPIALSLAGTIAIEERDEAAGRARMAAQAADRRVGGSVNARVTLNVSQADGGGTQILVVTEANVLGKLGEFGQPVIRKKSEQIMDQFVANLQRQLAVQT